MRCDGPFCSRVLPYVYFPRCKLHKSFRLQMDFATKGNINIDFNEYKRKRRTPFAHSFPCLFVLFVYPVFSAVLPHFFQRFCPICFCFAMSVANLFIDKHKRPTKDQGIMDIGKNCFFCSQLDFLPFICEFCKQTFCSSHRTVEKHQCPFKDKFYNQAPNITTTTTTTTIAATPSSNTVSSKTLFPDRAADRRLIDERLNSPKPTTIKETVLKAGAGNKDGVNALGKLQVFLNIQKKNSSTKSISKLFGKSKSSSTIVEMGKLKKEAIGHAKVTASDRIYIWCVYVKESSNMGINDIEQNRKALYVSKNWVIGKSLDSIADCLKISNQNNSTTKEDEKLRIFKLDDSGKPNLIQNSQKSSILKNGDTIYLVRGVV